MMNWLSRLTGHRGSTTTIKISGKEIEIICSASADKALAQRSRPLIVEMELAFACFARKTVRFHEELPGRELTYVMDQLAVYAHAVIPDRCEASQAASGSRAEAGRFVPKRLWIDFKKGRGSVNTVFKGARWRKISALVSLRNQPALNLCS